MKPYSNISIVYAILAMIGITHTHYFALGMMFSLVLLLLEKTFPFYAKY